MAGMMLPGMPGAGTPAGIPGLYTDVAGNPAGLPGLRNVNQVPWERLLSRFLKPMIGAPGPVYEGSLAPGASPLQQQAFAAAGQFMGPNAQRDPAVARLLGGEAGFVPDAGEQERFFQANVANPLFRDYERGLGSIDARLANMGLASSGVRARALTDANRGLVDSLERGRSELAYKDRQAMLASRESSLDRMSNAIAQSLGIDLAKIGTASDLGDIERTIEGQKASDAFRRFLEAQPIFNPALAIIGGPSTYRGAVSNPSATASPWGSVLAGLTGGLTGYFNRGASPAA